MEKQRTKRARREGSRDDSGDLREYSVSGAKNEVAFRRSCENKTNKREGEDELVFSEILAGEQSRYGGRTKKATVSEDNSIKSLSKLCEAEGNFVQERRKPRKIAKNHMVGERKASGEVITSISVYCS